MRLTHLVVADFRKDGGLRSPGADLLARSKPGTVGAALMLEEGAVITAFCYPAEYMAANFASVPRPAAFSGSQRFEVNPPRPGCDPNPEAPLLHRCWTNWVNVIDLVAAGVDLDSQGLPLPARYALILRSTATFCPTELSDDCVAALGPIGCKLRPRFGSFVPSPPRPGTTLGAAQNAPGKSGGAAGGDSGSTLMPILIGALGGFALVAVIAVVAFVAWRRGRGWGRRGGPGLEAEAPLPGDPETCGGAELCDRSIGDVAMAFGPSGVTTKESATTSGTEERRGDGRFRGPSAFSLLRHETGPSPARSLGSLAPSGQSLHDVITSQTPMKLDVLIPVVVAAPPPDAPGTTCGTSVATSTPYDTSSTATEGSSLAAAATPPDADVPVVQLTGRVLGKGAFGSVFEGVFNGQRVAVKQMCSTLDLNEQAKTQAFLQELEVLARCQHPNIVRLLAACATPPKPCIVLHIGIEIANGLDYLHPTVMHRDLKPANVLINDPCGKRPVVKLSDFNLSRLSISILVTKHPEAGTECFDVGIWAFTHKVDIYAFGVLLWEMLAGVQPWSGLTAMAIASSVTLLDLRLPVPPPPVTPGGAVASRWPPKLRRLLEDCWEKDPLRRPAAIECVKRLMLMQQASY
ncbi:hypothetical protein HYH03_013064 [Edaphochlamys debaryana]|uniref:Protein kinase domain-containing protein n=1 Tax=Edaphochlamys debaryana TaxID=47281 RepID=A0A835XWY7_9CHLO|nr:hypothetical protein HYH03_013064 [Edaphochlamys debaryana]|eukprot:KAG2488375.1 hypothetical protein HYH03_013064 [Edaphochlamys debaryana]